MKIKVYFKHSGVSSCLPHISLLRNIDFMHFLCDCGGYLFSYGQC